MGKISGAVQGIDDPDRAMGQGFVGGVRFFREKADVAARLPQQGKHGLFRSHIRFGDQINGPLMGYPMGLVVQVTQDATRTKGRPCRRPQNFAQGWVPASRDTPGNSFILAFISNTHHFLLTIGMIKIAKYHSYSNPLCRISRLAIQCKKNQPATMPPARNPALFP